MDGMTMMLSRLIGMKPEEMKAQVEAALSLMKTGAAAAEKMQRDIDTIKSHLGISDIAQENLNGGRTLPASGNHTNGNRIEL